MHLLTYASIFQEADIAIGALTVTSEREGVIDFSKSFMDFTMAILLKQKPPHYIGYFQFLRPFTVGTWISIVGAVSRACLTLTSNCYSSA